jgi:hypothetical protein
MGDNVIKRWTWRGQDGWWINAEKSVFTFTAGPYRWRWFAWLIWGRVDPEEMT